MKIVYVEWDDAMGIRGPVGQREATSVIPHVVYSAGVFIGEDEDYLRIALDAWSADEMHYRDLNIIPKSLIARRREWNVTDRKAR